jgi:ribonuclease HI
MVASSVPSALITKAKSYHATSFPYKTADGYLIAYTDGCCLDNGADNPRAGVGVWFGELHPL